MIENPYESPETSENLIVEQNNNSPLLPTPRMTKFFASTAWTEQAFRLFADNFWLWVGGVLLVILVSNAAGMVIPLLGSIVNAILSPILFAGISYAAHKSFNNESIEIGDFFSGFKIRGGALAAVGGVSLLGWTIITIICLAVYLSAATAIGALDLNNIFEEDFLFQLFTNTNMLYPLLLGVLFALLFALPLIAALFYAPTLLILHPELDFGQSLLLSFKGVFKNFFSFIPYSVIIMVVFFLGLLFFIVGVFVAIPLISLTIYTSYREIFLTDPEF